MMSTCIKDKKNILRMTPILWIFRCYGDVWFRKSRPPVWILIRDGYQNALIHQSNIWFVEETVWIGTPFFTEKPRKGINRTANLPDFAGLRFELLNFVQQFRDLAAIRF